jgi:hypothetical protein
MSRFVRPEVFKSAKLGFLTFRATSVYSAELSFTISTRDILHSVHVGTNGSTRKLLPFEKQHNELNGLAIQ